LSAVAAGDQVGYDKLRSVADLFLIQVTWLHDINYTSTYELIEERGILEAMEDHLPAEPGVQAILDRGRELVAARGKSVRDTGIEVNR